MNSQELVWTIAYLGMGANVGDRRESIAAALAGLHRPSSLEVLGRSSLYETAPVGVTDQPEFLNAVAEVRTTLSPQELLEAILTLEKKMGRVRNRRWGPRVIDIDILLYGDLTISRSDLIVPHPRLAERLFALAPLTEIAPEAVFPDGESAQKKMKTLLESTAKIGNNQAVRRV